MPKGLRRWYGGGEFHFITCSCYHRRAFLASARRKDLFLKILEEVREKYEFMVVGYRTGGKIGLKWEDGQ